MGNQNKFVTYEGLRVSLSRAKIKTSGSTATLLLECFVCNDGQLRAGMVVERGLCEEGKFSEWRKDLITKGWLVYVEGAYATHKPGAKLCKYINKEKMEREEIATKQELLNLRSDVVSKEEFNGLKSDFEFVKESVRRLIEKHDPPADKEKIEAYMPKSYLPKITASKKKTKKDDDEFAPRH